MHARNYVIYLVLLIVFTPVLSFAQLPDTMELDQFLQLARQRNIDVDAAKLDRNQADLEYRIFQASLRPGLIARANLPNYARTSREVLQPDGNIAFQTVSNNNSALGLTLSQNITQTGGTVFVRSDIQRFDDFQTDATLYNGVPIRIGIFQPLFGFNSFKWEKQLAPLRLEEANKKYISDLEDVNTEATRLFFNLLIARLNLNIADSNFSNNQSLFEIAEERHALGKISDSDLLQLKVSLLNSQRSQKGAQQSVRLASSDIYAYLGLNYDGRLLGARAPEASTTTTVDFEEALQKALATRFEQDSYERMQLEANREIARVKGTGGLQADLSASFGLTRSAMQLGEVYQSPQDEQFAQITLSVPILDWGEQKSRVAIAIAQKEYTDRLINQEQARFRTEIQQAVDQFNSIQVELELASSLQDVAKERFEIARQSFVLGAISITELTIAQQEKDQALRSYVSVLSQYWNSYYLLRALTLYDFKSNNNIR